MKTSKSIKRRAREIVRAAMGKPVQKITVGVEVKSCADCERPVCENCPAKYDYDMLLHFRSCITCGRANKCQHLPAYGEKIRINCIEWSKDIITGMEGQENGGV